MNFFQAAGLGFIQGLTEFLPVSSSGHLVISQKIFGFSRPPVLFDILIHLGTLLAVLVFFRKNFSQIPLCLWQLIIIGTIPAGLVGVFLNSYLEAIFSSLYLVGMSLLMTAALLFSVKLIKKTEKNFSQLNWLDAFFVGCFQALAIIPGISRSGSTVVSGLWRGLDRETAFVFSFYLAAPAMLGALFLQIPDLLKNGDQLVMGFVGLITAAFSGFLSLVLLKKVVLKGKLFYFAVYCLLLGMIVLFFTFFLNKTLL